MLTAEEVRCVPFHRECFYVTGIWSLVTAFLLLGCSIFWSLGLTPRQPFSDLLLVAAGREGNEQPLVDKELSGCSEEDCMGRRVHLQEIGNVSGPKGKPLISGALSTFSRFN